jgi:glycosyltransferase involved in cell wall biosynthesis
MPDGAGIMRLDHRPLSVLQTGLNWFDSGSGGLDRIYAGLIQNLPEFGIQVRGAVVGPADVESRTGGQVCTLAPPGASLPGRLVGARRTIARLVESGGVDLVAAHFAFHIATALDRLRRVPLVAHFHGPWSEESRCEGQSPLGVAVKRAVETLVYRRADRIIVLSKAFGELVCRRYGVSEERIRIVPGCVDLARFDTPQTRRQARQALDWPTDRPILLSVRRLTPRMGLDRLISALVQVVPKAPDILLCIAGRGPLEVILRRQIAELGLEKHVRFLGFVPDAMLPLAYRAADINVVPTVALEGFGLIAAEALAAGTPSMVTPIGGLPEVVSDLSPDLVFRDCTEAGLVAGLVAALRGELFLPSADKCRAFAANRFGTVLATGRTAAVYRELVG